MTYVAIVVLSYLIGSFPTALLVGRLVKGIDIRTMGSGNMGATNVFRVLGAPAGIVTLIVDVFKGFAATYWVSRLGSGDPVGLKILAGFSAILGHTFTLFAKFRGGKGMATAAGMLIAIAPNILLICVLVFVITVLLTGYVSVASLVGASLFGIIHIVLYIVGTGTYENLWLLFFSIVAPLFIFWTHRTNIQKLRRGEEHRFENLMIFKRKKTL
ncbi:MAG: glycerol-3-phosphate 1-O-acyltransferase PlsY [Candidatus Marinimicrobia bacterium]|nr:glycerol-3-phosphate 1-O-acyltransferase PlsY [Candidatus Neomarinimicrobiota bacterium]